jgi:hypothetical protein
MAKSGIAVCNDERRRTRIKRLQRLHQLRFGFRVQGGGGFIEDQHAGTPEQCAPRPAAGARHPTADCPGLQVRIVARTDLGEQDIAAEQKRRSRRHRSDGPSATMNRWSVVQPLAQGAKRRIAASPPLIAIVARGTIISRPTPSASGPKSSTRAQAKGVRWQITDSRGEVRRCRSAVPGSIRERAPSWRLALARLEPPVRLVDDVGAAAAADDTAIPVARLERLQAVANLHCRAPASFFQCSCCSEMVREPAAPLERGRSQVKAHCCSRTHARRYAVVRR